MKIEKFLELIKKGYNLDVIFIMSLLKNEEDVVILLENNKTKLLIDSIIRKGLITNEYVLTISGNELLEFINSPIVKLTKTKPPEDYFNTWWNEFPGNDKFSIGNIDFTPTRSFKVKKEDCRIKFNAILNEGEYTAEQLINALKYDVNMKKENSLKKRENQLKYLQNSFTYLHQRSFEGFIDLIMEEKQDTDYDEGINI